MVSKEPTIRLIFTGLQVFFFDEDTGSCRVGMHNQAPHHELCVEVREFHNNLKTSVKDLSEDVRGYDMHLKVANPQTKGAKAYKVGESFNRKSPGHDEKDFRWIIGMRSNEFHGSVPVDDNVIQPSFHTNCGLFHTHSKMGVQLVGGKKNVEEEIVIADRIGADIELDDECNEAVLTYGNYGEKSLTFSKKPNTRYEITISNDCPDSKTVESEFKLYYKVFKVEDNEQFDLKPSAVGREGGPHSPCAPVCGQISFC